MARSIQKYLYDIQQSISSIEEYLGEKRDFFAYEQNKLLRRAVERELEIIGEAAKHILDMEPDIQIDDKDTYDFFNEKYNNCEIRYGDLKKQLAEDINNFCAPIREKIIDIRSNDGNWKLSVKQQSTY